MDLVAYDYDLSCYNAGPDLRRIGWRPLVEQIVHLEPTEIPEEVYKLEILKLITFLHSISRDPSGRDRIPIQ